MSTITFLGAALQALAAEAAGIAVVAVILFGYIKIMSAHSS